MPLPSFSNGLAPTEAWLASYGDPAGFHAQSGTSNRVLAPLAAVGTLLPTATPAATACLRMNGSGYRASNLPDMSRRMFYAVCVKLTADGTFLQMGGGDWSLAVSSQSQLLTVGGTTGPSNCSPGQWGVYTGYCGDSFGFAFFNQMNFAGVNPAPANVTNLPGRFDLPAFSGFWAGAMYGPLPAQGYLDNQQHGELCRYFYQRVLWPGGAVPEVLVEGNSLSGGISTADADDVWPALVQDGLGAEAVVQSLACASGYIDVMRQGVQDRIDAAADPARTQVIVYPEGTNGWMFSNTYGQNATALFNAEMDLLRARRQANPDARIIFATYPWRDSTVSGVAQNLFDAGRVTYSGLADALATRSTAHSYVKLASPDNDAFHILVQTHLIPGLQSYSAELWQADRTHMTRAGQLLWADPIAYAVRLAIGDLPSSAPPPLVSVTYRGGAAVEGSPAVVLDPSTVTVRVVLSSAVGTVLLAGLTGVLCERDGLAVVAGPTDLTWSEDSPYSGDLEMDVNGLDPGQYLWFVRSTDAVIARGLLTVERSGFSA